MDYLKFGKNLEKIPVHDLFGFQAQYFFRSRVEGGNPEITVGADNAAVGEINYGLEGFDPLALPQIGVNHVDGVLQCLLQGGGGIKEDALHAVFFGQVTGQAGAHYNLAAFFFKLFKESVSVFPGGVHVFAHLNLEDVLILFNFRHAAYKIDHGHVAIVLAGF